MHTYKNYLKEEKLDLTQYAIDDKDSESVIIFFLEGSQARVAKGHKVFKYDNNGKIFFVDKYYKIKNGLTQSLLDKFCDELNKQYYQPFFLTSDYYSSTDDDLDHDVTLRVSVKYSMIYIIPKNFYTYLIEIASKNDNNKNRRSSDPFWIKQSIHNLYGQYTMIRDKEVNKNPKHYQEKILVVKPLKFFQNYNTYIRNKDNL